MFVRVIPSSHTRHVYFPILLVFLAFVPSPPQTHAHPVDSDPGRKAADFPVHPNSKELAWKWHVENYPNPQSNFQQCMQPKPSNLCDPDKKLSKEEASALTQSMERIQNEIVCLCKETCRTEDKGIVVGIAILGNLEHGYHEDLSKVSHEFAVTTMQKWNLGTCENGMLLVLPTDNSVPHLETGSAVKSLLSEETITDILKQCSDHLKSGHYFQGLESILNSVYDKAKTMQTSPDFNKDDTSTGSVGLTVGLVVGFAVLAGLFAAGLVLVRRRRQEASNDKFMYDGSVSRPGSRPGSRGSGKDSSGPIVKMPVVFPDAVYQPCSVNDPSAKINTKRQSGSDEEDETENSEDQYLRNLEENPAYESADTMLASPRTLSAVTEEDSDQHSPTEVEPPLASVHSPNNLSHPETKNDRERDAYA